MKLSNLSRKHAPNTTWPKEKKLQAVTQYLALGNMKLVAASTGVSYDLLRQWKLQPWWKEFEREIRATENLGLDSDLTKIVKKSLETVADRLENGEVFYNQKTGTLERKPVLMKDAAKVTTDMLTKRELLRGNATNRSEQAIVPMADQLKALADAFARMSKGLPPADIVDVDAVDVTYKDEDGTEVAHNHGVPSELRTDDEWDGSSEMGTEDGDSNGDNHGGPGGNLPTGLSDSGLDQQEPI